MTVVTNLKQRLKAVVPSYLDTDKSVAGGYTNYATYFLSVDTNARSIPAWTATGLLVSCRMPTNWFDYTPRRGLTGLGWETNDSSVGWPHGYTNAQTVLGGTNFPPSRTSATWYTTDYGLSAATGLFSRLTDLGYSHTLKVGDYTFYATYNGGGPYDGRYSSRYYAEVWLDNDLSDLRGIWQRLAYGNYWQSIPSSEGYDYAHESTARWRIRRGLYTNAAVTVDYFMNTVPYENLNPGGPVAHTEAFVYSGSPVSSFTGYYTLQKVTNWSFSAGETNLLLSSWLGDLGCTVTKYGLAPDYNEKPTEPYISTKGWQFRDTHYLILRYDFVYK